MIQLGYEQYEFLDAVHAKKNGVLFELIYIPKRPAGAVEIGKVGHGGWVNVYKQFRSSKSAIDWMESQCGAMDMGDKA